MKKKILIFTMLAALMAVPVFAATMHGTQAPEERSQQMTKNHQEMIQQGVDNGTITAEEAAEMNEHMEKMAPIMGKLMNNKGMMKNGGMMGNCPNNNIENDTK